MQQAERATEYRQAVQAQAQAQAELSFPCDVTIR